MSTRLPDFADCQKLERFNGGDYCEKKNLVCYASAQTKGIVVKNLETGETKLVTAGGSGEANPSFSPDGSQILFLSIVKGQGR